MAYIQRRGSSYLIRVSLGLDSSGKQVTKSTTFTPDKGLTEKQTQKALQRAVIDFEEKCQKGYTLEKISFEEYAKRWLTLNETNHAPITQKRYKELLVIINKHLGHFHLEKLTAFHIQEFYKILASMEYSPQTQRHFHRLIHTVLQSAYKLRLIDINPASLVTPPKVQKKEPAHLDDKQAQNFVACLVKESDIRINTALLLLLYGGFRIGELTGLEWQDVNFSNCTITIARTSQHVNKGLITKLPKNDTSIRTVTLPNEMFSVLSDYRKYWLEYKLKLGSHYVGVADRLFTQDNGNPIYSGTISKWLQKFIIKHDLPKITPHSLRHTNITLQIMAGIPIRQISARAGHSNTSTTLNIYSHAIQSMDVVASEKLSEILAMPE